MTLTPVIHPYKIELRIIKLQLKAYLVGSFSLQKVTKYLALKIKRMAR